MLDALADCLSRIANAAARGFSFVSVRRTNHVSRFLNVLQEEGYISSIEAVDDRTLQVGLKYLSGGAPIISKLSMVSKPSRRVYAKSKELGEVRNGLGFYVVSTSRGVFSSRKAKSEGLGGEVLAVVY